MSFDKQLDHHKRTPLERHKNNNNRTNKKLNLHGEIVLLIAIARSSFVL